MTNQQRQVAAEEMVRRDREENWPEDRHDTAPMGDVARKGAGRCAGLMLDAIEEAFCLTAPNGRASTQKVLANIIQHFMDAAISASERELVEALEPFAKYSRARLEIFGEHSLNSYLYPQVCNGRITADIDKADWDRARAVLAKRGHKC